MPKRSNKHVGDDYESDDGFVEDAPKSKKQKKELSSGMQRDDDGNEYWEVRTLQSPAVGHISHPYSFQASAASKSAISKAAFWWECASSMRKMERHSQARR